jgi:lipoyl(octanoyl) transferase
MAKQVVLFQDLGKMDYQQAWDLQEALLQANIAIKAKANLYADVESGGNENNAIENNIGLTKQSSTMHHLLFVEHSPVFTLGKSGHIENVLINETEMQANGIQFFRTNRGGDITFHGAGQIVGYPILDLEKFSTDIGKYLRNLEEVVILTLAGFGIKGERSVGETGVWIAPGIPGMERKICAIGVRCSRWITMHGFALNVNTDLSYFNHIVPCGIQNKQVSSIQQELGRVIDEQEVKLALRNNFELVFEASLINIK